MRDRRQLRAIGAALLIGWMFIMGTPGLDLVGPRQLQRAQTTDAWWGPPLEAVAMVTTTLRDPVVERLTILERPLGLAQAWSLYASGPEWVRRVEIYVDGVLRYRSGDARADWLEPALRYRRLRGIIGGICRDGQHSQGLRDWVTRAARRDFPEARTLRFRCTASEWPGEHLVRERERTVSLMDRP